MGCWAFLGVIAVHPLGREAIAVIQYLHDSSARSVWKQGHLVELSCPLLLWAAVRPMSALQLHNWKNPIFWRELRNRFGSQSNWSFVLVCFHTFLRLRLGWTSSLVWYTAGHFPAKSLDSLLFESKCPSTPCEAGVCSLLLCVCTVKSVGFKVVLNWFWFTLWCYYKLKFV